MVHPFPTLIKGKKKKFAGIRHKSNMADSHRYMNMPIMKPQPRHPVIINIKLAITQHLLALKIKKIQASFQVTNGFHDKYMVTIFS